MLGSDSAYGENRHGCTVRGVGQSMEARNGLHAGREDGPEHKNIGVVADLVP